MKERYENAEMDILEFVVEDVISTSDIMTSSHYNSYCPEEAAAADSFL